MTNIVLTKNNTPFKSESAAARAMKAAGIHSEIVEIGGGYGYRNVKGAGVPDSTTPQDRAKGKQLEIAKRLFHAGVESCLSRRYQDHQLQFLSEVSSDPNYLEAPVTAFNTVACRTQSIVGGGQFGEDIDVPKYAQSDVMFMLESVFQAAVSRVCSAERRLENQQRIAMHQLADKHAHNQPREQNQVPNDVQDYIDALDILSVELAKVWEIYATRPDRVNKHTLPWGSQVEDSILNTRTYLYDYRSARISSDKYAEQMKREEMMNARARAQAASFNL